MFAQEMKFLQKVINCFDENISTHLSGLKESPLDTISTIVSVSLNAFKLSTPLAVLRGSTYTKYLSQTIEMCLSMLGAEL